MGILYYFSYLTIQSIDSESLSATMAIFALIIAILLFFAVFTILGAFWPLMDCFTYL